MPTLFYFFGFQFSFFANDHLPIHIHAIKGNAFAKIRVEPCVELVEQRGVKASEVKKILEVVQDNREIIIQRWNEFFNQ